jgi:regulatory protein YycH of two-component signal transduction system YycFG
MERSKDIGLNVLLALVVVVSILLSGRVWFPPDPGFAERPPEAQVQSTAPVLIDRMPDVFRPERLYVRLRTGLVAMVVGDTTTYKAIWPRMKALLLGMHPDQSPVMVDEPDWTDGDTLQIIFPFALSVGEWADQWSWDTTNLRNHMVKMDRMIIHLGKSPAIYMTGLEGKFYKVTTLGPPDVKTITETIGEVAVDQYQKYHPLNSKELSVRTQGVVDVLELKEVPLVKVSTRRPDSNVEVVRYFPDLSVVRQVDEKEAKSFTDGQRFLRFAANGEVEYRTATTSAGAPDLTRALDVAQDWMNSHGGWPQNLVLSRVETLARTTRLEFAYRVPGPFPVEVETGAFSLSLNGDRVADMKRSADFSLDVTEAQQKVITPEQAVQLGVQGLPQLFQSESIRDVHMSYRMQATTKGWSVEPCWVIQVGTTRVYVPATISDKRPEPRRD